jgi:hypothetical protein
MTITEVDVRGIEIQNAEIARLIEETQQNSVKNALEVIKAGKEAETTVAVEKAKREKLSAVHATTELEATNAAKATAVNQANLLKEAQTDLEISKAANEVIKIETASEELEGMVAVTIEKHKSEIRTKEFEAQFNAIQPKLIEALIASGQMKLAEELAKAIPASRNTLHDILDVSTISVLKNAVKGTPLEKGLQALMIGENGSLVTQ